MRRLVEAHALSRAQQMRELQREGVTLRSARAFVDLTDSLTVALLRRLPVELELVAFDIEVRPRGCADDGAVATRAQARVDREPLLADLEAGA
jgi:hypothetical protein